MMKALSGIFTCTFHCKNFVEANELKGSCILGSHTIKGFDIWLISLKICIKLLPSTITEVTGELWVLLYILKFMKQGSGVLID